MFGEHQGSDKEVVTMKKTKLILEQTFMLSFLMQVVMGLEALYSYLINDPVSFSWYIPLTTLLASFLCSLPTLIFMTERELPKALQRTLPLLHCLLLYVLVMGMGYLFHWYSTLTYFLVTSVSYFVIYTLVWTFSNFLKKYDEKLINDALLTIRDED